MRAIVLPSLFNDLHVFLLSSHSSVSLLNSYKLVDYITLPCVSFP